jgi:LacI family transcriptional regulator
VATIKDVALRAGVGLGTASRVISGNGYAAPATVARVQKAIDELGFRPSHAARALLSGTSQMIGVYIPLLKGAFYTPIMQVINTELRSAGLNMVVAFGMGLDDARRQAIDGIDFLFARGCDGVLAMTSSLLEEDIAVLGERKSHIVFMNHHLPSLDDQRFSPDHHYGGVLAARALIEHGHREIAIIGGPESAPDNVERLAGFMEVLQEAGIDPASVWCAQSDFSPEGGRAEAARLIESRYPFTAVFCANDEMAMGAMSHFQEVGRAVPRSISVIGYDDLASADFSTPRLTSVRIPWPEIAVSALNALVNRCYDKQRPVTTEFKISLTQRASLARLGG